MNFELREGERLNIASDIQDFIVIACDGLWDTVSPEAAKDSVFKTLKDNKGKQQVAAELKEINQFPLKN